MKTKQFIKAALAGIVIVAVGLLLRGHDVLTGIALVTLALLVAVKIVAAIIFHRRGSSGPYDGGRPPYTPTAIPPNRPKTPELTGALKS
jgi:hypothetical protein